MKKNTPLYLIVVMLVCALKGNSQGFYFKVNAGYGVPIAPTVIGQQSTRAQDQTGNNNTIVTTTKNTPASFTAGASGTVGAGFMFNKFLGAELNVQFISSKKFETNDIYTYKSDNSNGSEKYVSKIFSRAVFINPAFVVSPGPKLPYARFGVVLGAPKIKEEQSYYYDLDGTDTRSIKGEYKMNMALGFQGALGMKWMIANSLDIFAEVSVISMTSYTKSYKITEYINNGQDALASIQPYYKETNYNKELVTNNLQSTDYTKPQEAIREERSCSSLALQVGVIYLLGKRSID